MNMYKFNHSFLMFITIIIFLSFTLISCSNPNKQNSSNSTSSNSTSSEKSSNIDLQSSSIGNISSDSVIVSSSIVSKSDISNSTSSPVSSTVVAKNLAYYVDSANGDDNNSGKSTQKPWKTLGKVNSMVFSPGDVICFKSNAIFEGQFKPQGSGTPDKPIIVTSYGGDVKPIISGLGVQPATVHLYNIQYWELNNLEITNYNDTVTVRSGILIDNEDGGILNHIYIKDMYIHDVNGANLDSNWGYDRINGGIIVYTHGFITKSAFNDILIQRNYIKKVDRSGIFVYSTWSGRDTISEGYGQWFPSTNVVIRNNVLNNIGGDGIVTAVTDGPLVEYNLVTYSNNRSGKNNIAIWTANSDNSVFQYNEAAYTQLREGDGEGFDIDFGGTNNIMQYNYSHDNMGGFMLVCSFSSVSNKKGIVRYNISQNDRSRIIRVVGAATTQCYFYNNTIYMGPLSNAKLLLTTGPEGDAGEAYFYNNIFINLGTGGNDITDGAIFDYNCFYTPNLTIKPNDPHIITADPMLVNGGSGGIGINTVDGYKLKTGSPCINAGRAIENNGGKDYWGNKVPNGLTDIGAQEKQ